MEYPKITLVTPSFNQGQFIEDTIVSVLSQDYPNLEYIIIDGGSSDNSVEVIKKYEESIAYWISEPDDGQSHAINKGLEKASGLIFNWLNSDDQLLPGALFNIAESFMKNPGAEVIIGIEKEYFMHDLSREEYFKTTISDTLEETLYIGRIIQSATFYSMDVIKRLGPLNKDLHYLMDAEWWMKYLFRFGLKKIIVLEKVLTLFRIHEDSKTSSKGFGFGKERKLIERSLALSMKIPEKTVNEVIGKMESYFPVFENLLPADELDLLRLRSYFDRDYYYQFFIISDFKNSRKSLSNYLRRGRPEWNFILVMHCLKIFLFPGWTVKLFRNVTNYFRISNT